MSKTFGYLIRVGDVSGERIPIGRDGLTMGRDAAAADFVVQHPVVSRCHARFEARPNGDVILTDMDSINGTFLNSVKISRPVVLASGDQVNLGGQGRVAFVFERVKGKSTGEISALPSTEETASRPPKLSEVLGRLDSEKAARETPTKPMRHEDDAEEKHPPQKKPSAETKKANFQRLEGVDQHHRKYKRDQVFYGLLLLLVIGLVAFANWWTVHRPLVLALDAFEFKDAVHIQGHYRHFCRPGSIIIHITALPAGISGEQFTNLLTSLAGATRSQALTGSPYYSVELARGWATRYVLRGEAWKELARQKDLPAPKRAELLVNNLYLPDGKPALKEQSDNLWTLKEQREKTFNAFFETFTAQSVP
ncbi:MAG: FHA domain-containing protein [Verrucomicrobia bacterium]|nr:FHA domain-containing protein [Verrucomicrobiota bacterium]